MSDHRSIELIVLPHRRQLPDCRPVRRFHPSWLYCRVHNDCDEPLFVYGPRHSLDETTLPTSLFLLPAGSSTPKRWDCKGILIPSDRSVDQGPITFHGPVALKYWDMRRIRVTVSLGHYHCARSNGRLGPGLLDFAVPHNGYKELLRFPRRVVLV